MCSQIIEVERLVNGPWRQNCYIADFDGRGALVIDPGSEAEIVENWFNERQATPLAVLNTHAHYDHIGGVHRLMSLYNIPFYLHGGDDSILKRANLYRRIFGGGANITVPAPSNDFQECPAVMEIGPFQVRWHHVPGHTPGSVALQLGDNLFTGDTLFRDGAGRTDLPGGDAIALRNSLGTLSALEPNLTIRPGHGGPSRLGDALALALEKHPEGAA